MNFDEVINRRRSESYKWREYPEDVLPLFVADMDFRSPDPVARALGAYVDEGIFGYPRGLHSHDRAQVHELAALVVDRMAHRYKWQIAADDVIAIPGVVPGLNIACRSLREGSVLVQPPVYPPVLAAPKNSNLQLVESPLHCQDDGSYSIDWDSFRSGVAQDTRLFILCNPHNPVGRVFRRDELERMAEICLSANVTICSDEIHSDLLLDRHQHIPIATLDPEIASHTVTLISPSKTFNLAGLQCAFAIIPNSELRQQFRSAREGLVPSVDTGRSFDADEAVSDWNPAHLEHPESRHCVDNITEEQCRWMSITRSKSQRVPRKKEERSPWRVWVIPDTSHGRAAATWCANPPSTFRMRLLP